MTVKKEKHEQHSEPIRKARLWVCETLRNAWNKVAPGFFSTQRSYNQRHTGSFRGTFQVEEGRSGFYFIKQIMTLDFIIPSSFCLGSKRNFIYTLLGKKAPHPPIPSEKNWIWTATRGANQHFFLVYSCLHTHTHTPASGLHFCHTLQILCYSHHQKRSKWNPQNCWLSISGLCDPTPFMVQIKSEQPEQSPPLPTTSCGLEKHQPSLAEMSIFWEEPGPPVIFMTPRQIEAKC